MTKNKKIFISGADGFIGSHLTESLVIKGYDVRAMVFSDLYEPDAVRRAWCNPAE